MDRICEADRGDHLVKQDFMIKNLKIFLIVNCCWHDYKQIYVKVIKFLLHCVYIFLLSGQVLFIYYHWGNIDLMISASCTMVCMIQLVFRNFFLTYHSNALEKILQTIRYEFWPLNSFDEDESIWKKLKLITYSLRIFGWSTVLCALVWMNFPYADALPGQRKKPVLCWYPFDVNRSPVHEILCFFDVLAGIMVCMGCVGDDQLFAYLIMNIVAQYRLLGNAMKGFINSGSGIRSEKEIYSEMIFYIEYHQKLSRVCGEVRSIYNSRMTLLLLTTGTNICATFFLISTVTDPGKVFKLVEYFLCMLIEMALYCVIGSILESESEEVANCAYSCDWYRAHPRIRLGLIHMIQAARTPQTMSASGLLVMNNKALVQVLKTAFSISTLLNSMN